VKRMLRLTSFVVVLLNAGELDVRAQPTGHFVASDSVRSDMRTRRIVRASSGVPMHTAPAPDRTDNQCPRAGAAADGGESLADLVLELPADEEAFDLEQRLVSEDSCELYEGCARGHGLRSLLNLRFALRNVGADSIHIGRPADSRLFDLSPCQSTYTLYDFFEAELLNPAGDRVAHASLSTNCIADEAGNFDCVSQGLGAGERTTQPMSQCDFIDITDVPTGDYTLRLTVNPNHTVCESNYSNNATSMTIHHEHCSGTYCGNTCCPTGAACVDQTCMVPDLRINEETAKKSVWFAHQTFEQNSCELEEMCVAGSGRRRLLMFEGRIENWGPADLDLGSEEDNPAFEFSACHEHYHLKDFTDYRLRNQDGSVAATGHKQSFCLTDMVEAASSSEQAPPGTHPPPLTSMSSGIDGPTTGDDHGTCSRLSAGWADVYGVGTPCQWIDITGFPEGDYILELEVNPLRKIPEVSTDNNMARIPVHIPAEGSCVPEPEICNDWIDQDCDEQFDLLDPDCGGVCALDPSLCAPSADNDNCERAREIVEAGTYPALILPRRAVATSSGCDASGAAAYFRFNLSQRQLVYVGSLQSQIDTVLTLYADACGANELDCADDVCGTQGGHFIKLLEPGTYFIAVQAKDAAVGGQVALDIHFSDPFDAIVVDGAGVYAGNLENANDTLSACVPWDSSNTGTNGMTDDVYAIAACAGTFIASTCGTASFDSKLDIRSQSTATMIACSESTQGCQSDSRGATAFSIVSAGLVLVTVEAATSYTVGAYQLSITN
jgi:Lysyl oxidase